MLTSYICLYLKKNYDWQATTIANINLFVFFFRCYGFGNSFCQLYNL